jgi:hypothetical protein
LELLLILFIYFSNKHYVAARSIYPDTIDTIKFNVAVKNGSQSAGGDQQINLFICLHRTFPFLFKFNSQHPFLHRFAVQTLK